jgi:hypothetical protein
MSATESCVRKTARRAPISFAHDCAARPAVTFWRTAAHSSAALAPVPRWSNAMRSRSRRPGASASAAPAAPSLAAWPGPPER